MTARYLLCPGTVQSATDRQWHHVGASQLAMLYGVRMDECLIAHEPNNGNFFSRKEFEGLMARVVLGELIELRPRRDGNYTLPAPPPPANPYGCHNRAPTAAPDCQYTLSALGQKDPRCIGCQWRRVS